MKKNTEHKESRGLPGGPNEYITHVSNLFSTEGYKRNSPDVNNPYNIIPSGNITMEGVDFPVYGRDNLGNEQIMKPGGNYQFPGDSVLEVPMAQTGFEVPKRQGVRDNGDGSESTHLMATETLDGKNWFSFPTLFQDPDGTWIDMSTKPWKEAYKEAQRRGEVIDFGTDKESAIKFGKGSWKPKAQDGTEVEEKSVWGLVKEMAKVPAANISNLLGVMGIPANLIAEATESFTGRGDGEFNFMNAMPSFATPGSDDETFTFTNQNGTPVKNVAGLKDANGNPLVENPVGAFITNLATDPSTYVGAGVAKNLINNVTQAGLKKGLKKTIAKEVVENTVKVADNVKPSWSRGVTNYGRSPEGIQDALTSMKSQGKHLDEIGFNANDVISPNVINHGNKFGRQIAEVALPNGQSQLFYKSSGLAGKKGAGKTGTTEGLWQPYGGHASTGATDNWFIKDAGYENFYDSNSFKGIANKLDEIESGWDMSKQVLKSKLKYGGIPKAQDGNGEDKVDNSKILDYNNISNYIVETRGGTKDTWGQLADTIAFHESSPWSRMDPKAKQYQGGPGRGLFQFEGESFNTALKRYKNVADAKGYTIKDSIVNATSADQLSSEDQYALFFANLIESKAKLSDFTNGNLSPVDLWLQGHKNVEAEGDRASFLESKKAAEKEGIKNGYKSFQYGNGEWRTAVQDNTRVATRRVIPNLGKPEFEPASKLQEFLKQAGADYVNNQMLDTTVVRDNTAITQKQLPFIKDGNLNEPLSPEEYNSVIADLDKESRLEKSKYKRPNLVSDFTKSSNDYARGWKDMTNASPSEVETLQKDLLSKGYDIGATGADGDYGAKTFAAHKSMIDDVNLAPSAISKYYKNYNPDNKEEVLRIQQDLVDKGFMSATLLNKEGSSIDGKFGQQTKEALQAYNTKKTEEDPNALVFDFIPSKLKDGRCAAGMCSILEGNNVMTESLGIKYKNAWDIFENMNDVENSKSVFNIYDDKAFDNATSAEDIKRITKEVKRKKQTKASDYKTGDIVGLYWDGSSHHEETLNSKTHNTHTGFVSDVIDGVPIITHNVNGTVLQQPYDELVTGWIRRPKEDIKVNSTYNVDGIEDIEIDPSTIRNLSLRYQSGDYEGERLTQLENVFKRAKYNSTKIPEILNSSVDPKWLESTIVGITGAETGVGASVPRSKEDAGYVKNMVYDYKGYKPKDVSLGIGKTKLTALDNFAKSYFQINSADDLGKSDDKAIDAITYLITKNYETFKDYSNTYPELNLAEEDIRNMSILAYNQGTNRLLKTGRVADSRNAETEVQALRELYDATLLDINSTNYKHLPIIGDAAFKVGQVLPTGMPGSVRPSDSYIKKVNKYRTDLFPENYAYVETPANDFEPSTMAHGGEPKSKVNELTMYKNYMKGMYDNTNMQKQAQKVYDKLNRVYLRKARLGGTTSPNYIMSNIIRETA